MHLDCTWRLVPWAAGRTTVLFQISGTVWWLIAAVIAAVAAVGFVGLGVWIIGADRSGLVVKRFGPALESGRIIARSGQAGYQAKLLPPGWHFGLWRWRY